MKETLSDYERLRMERIARNNERLAKLGLLNNKSSRPSSSSSSSLASNTSKTTPKKKVNTTKAPAPTPTRISRRLSGKRPLYKADDQIDDATPKRVKAERQRVSGAGVVARFRIEIPDAVSAPLTEDQKEVINRKVEGDFLAKFEDYLVNVDVVSERNRKSVMRQITKLSKGEGIRYESKAFGWPENCYFMKDTQVGPTDDILKLMEIGRQCENEWGQDHGNGWLLSHPLKKLYMFQQYYLEH